MSTPRLSPTRSQANAALVVGTVALLMLGLQPILLGELVAQKLITLEGVGVVAMGEIICVGLGAILGDSVLPLTRMRGITVLAALAVAALDLLTMTLNGDVSYVSVRALCGLAEGVLVWVATCSIVRRASPERLASIFLVAQTLAQAAVAAVLALFVIPHGGWQAGFAVLAGLVFHDGIRGPGSVPGVCAAGGNRFDAATVCRSNGVDVSRRVSPDGRDRLVMGLSGPAGPQCRVRRRIGANADFAGAADAGDRRFGCRNRGAQRQCGSDIGRLLAAAGRRRAGNLRDRRPGHDALCGIVRRLRLRLAVPDAVSHPPGVPGRSGGPGGGAGAGLAIAGRCLWAAAGIFLRERRRCEAGARGLRQLCNRRSLLAAFRLAAVSANPEPKRPRTQQNSKAKSF